jgi:hypothetical protein
MMWVRLIGSVFILGGGLVSARSGDESVAALESCFQSSRIADAICSKLPADSALRPDCFQKTRSAEFECLEHALSETPAATLKTPSETTRLEPPGSAALPERSSEHNSPPAQTGTLKMPAGIPSAKKSNSPPNAIVRTTRPGSEDTPTGAILPDISPTTADVPVRPTGTNWVTSETTSPVDYSPLVTALIRSTSQVKDTPSTLAVRCRGQRTDLLVGTNGTWATTRGHELRVDYQVDNQPAVGMQWILSSDGKTATYKDDPVSFLQSLPDGARLKINVADRTSSSHEATFQIDGWNVIRNKIGTACNWARRTDKTSSRKR